jgi:putative nucleotidyltransferase with HDIG domain
MTPDRPRDSAARDAALWAARAPYVPEHWFAHDSSLHGVRHTQRVYIHVQRLTRQLGFAELDAQLVLKAALLHDIGRTDDGVDHGHGEASATRAVKLGLTRALAPADADSVLFAVFFHCLPDGLAEEEAPRRHEERGPRGASRLPEPQRALRILWLLKDADALDRVRLILGEAADPRQLRHPESAAHLPFAAELYRALD